MKIDPCPCVISLKDGSVHTLFEFRHFLELVEDCMGYDAAKWLRTHVEQAEKAADYTQAKAGNSKVANNHTSTASAVWWWLRSPYYTNDHYFCNVSYGGNTSHSTAYYSAGVRPGFAV